MRILIIEDSPEMGKILKKELEKLAFAVDLCRNGKTGAFLTKTNKYELIILDLILPEKNGHQILKELRETDNQTVVMAISIYNQADDRITWYNLGADDYLAKPFTVTEFITRVKNLTKRVNRPVLPKKLIYMDLEVDTVNYQVWRKKKIINLTKKEFLLLKFFIFNQNQVLSKSVIMEKIWDMNADSFSNTIETHIMRLRKKTEKYGKRLIHTVNGHGYKLD